MPTVDPQTEEQRQADLEKWQSAIRARQNKNRDDFKRKREAIEEESLKKAWQVHEHTDAITDRLRYQARNWKIGDDVLSVLCDIGVTGKSQLAVTFNTDTSVATPSSQVNFTVRIDKNEPMTFKTYLYNDSYSSMYFKITGPQGRRLIDQMKTGEDVNIRVKKYSQSHTFRTTVKGATDAFTEVVEKCS